MVALLGRLRREMNGVVADALNDNLPVQVRYGLNLGLSIPTIRLIAKEEGRDHAFAKYLYLQDVRELRMVALSMADPKQVTAEELPFWMQGRMPIELIEELALVLFSRTQVLPALLPWLERPEPSLVYVAMMALSRGAEYSHVDAVSATRKALTAHSESRLVAQGAVTLLTSLANFADSRPAVLALTDALDQSTVECYVREEMAWRVPR